jgi:signal transduction histidine kinase/DNA-binding response OmpR family regulator
MAIQPLLEYLEIRNLPLETLLAGVPYTLDYLRNKHERIEWDMYCKIMANLRMNWSDDDFEQLGFGLTRTVPFRKIMIVAKFLFTPPEAYSWWISGRGPARQFFDCVTPTIERVGENHLFITLTLPPGYHYCRELFLTTKGSLAAGTEVMGLGVSHVSMQETEHGAIYEIICPGGGGAIARIGKALMWPFAARAAARELKDAKAALYERYAQLEDAKEKVERQATQLKVAYDISRLIHANLDLDSTLQAIAGSLVKVAGFAAATLSVGTLATEEHVERIVKAGIEPSGSPQVNRTLEVHGNRIGEITLWLPAGSDVREADELMDYVIPIIEMEIDNALSFKLVADYQNSLQRKVDERTQELKEANESLKKGQTGRDRLFSNISHEFRTPLTLILGPLERILEETRDTSTRRRLGLMKKNATKILKFINQILDLSRLQAGDVNLLATETELISFLRGVVMSFRSLADSRHIRLTFRSESKSLLIYLDREKAESLFNNLLVNAFKFTPDRGRIDVAIREVERAAQVVIRDSGVGIPESEIPFVFDQFYQGAATGDYNIGGTGIGLALTKELVELHHGTVQASSMVGLGSVFEVSLPLGRKHLRDWELAVPHVPSDAEEPPARGATESRQFSGKLPETEAAPPGPKGKRGSIVLIIDDDPDVREYIGDILAPEMQVLEAADGDRGIQLAQKMIPDLIICDIMMPRRDGIEVCRKLKGDFRTSHIPIILLTAKAGTENRIQGLEKGADEYIIKPFVSKELLARVRNLIAIREQLRKRFNSDRILKHEDSPASSMERVFLQNAIAIVERHMRDEEFRVDDFSREIGLSRAQLHRKLIALTDCSARDFIRRLRLERAFELLHSDAGNVSEIAFQVGFRDPSHFAKSFRKQFGVPPGAFHAPLSKGVKGG